MNTFLRRHPLIDKFLAGFLGFTFFGTFPLLCLAAALSRPQPVLAAVVWLIVLVPLATMLILSAALLVYLVLCAALGLLAPFCGPLRKFLEENNPD